MSQPEFLDEFNSTLLANLGIEKDGYGRVKRQTEFVPGESELEIEQQQETKSARLQRKVSEYKEMRGICVEFLDKIGQYLKDGDTNEKISKFRTNEEFMKETKRICQRSMDAYAEVANIVEEMAKSIKEDQQEYVEELDKILNNFMKKLE